MCSTYIMKNAPNYFQKGFWTLNWRESYLLSTWVWKITCRRFDWMLQSSSIRAKVKKCETNTPIYSHALLRIWIIGGQRSNHHHFHWEVLDYGRGQELLVKEALHIQMTSSEEYFNWDGGLEVPGCWTTWWGGREGGAILTDIWLPLTHILSSA